MMKKLVKVLLSIISIIIVFAIIIALTIVFVINPNTYKPQIAQAVKSETGRDLTIEGDIKLSFFPWLGFEVGTTHLSNAPGFQEPFFAKVAQAKTRVKVLPLFQKRLEIDTISLEGVEFNLTRRADGQNNWEDLLKQEPTPSTDKTMLPFQINGIELSRSKVIWNDQMTKTALRLSELQLKTGMMTFNQPIEIKLTSQFEYSNIKPLQGKADFSTQLTLDLEKQLHQLDSSRLVIDVQGEMIPNRQQQFILTSPHLKVDLKQQNVQFNWQVALANQASPLTLGGTIQVNQLLTQPQVQGQLHINPFNLPKAAKSLGLPTITLPAPLSAQAVSLTTQLSTDFKKSYLEDVELKVDNNTFAIPKVEFDLVEKKLDLATFSLKALGSTLTGQLKLEQLATAHPTVSGQFHLTANPQEVLKQLGTSLPPLPIPLASASVKVGVQGHLQQMTLTDLQLMVDEQQLNIPQIQVNISEDQVIINDLTVKALGLTAQGQISAHLFKQPLGITGQLKVNTFDPRLLLKQFNQTVPVTSDKNVLKSLALATELETNLSELSLKNLNFQLDDHSLQGNITIRDFKKPAGTFELKLGSLDADRYLPPKEVKKVTKPEKVPEKSATVPLFSPELLKTLQALDLEGSLNIDYLKIAEVKMSNLQIILSGKEGKITVLPKATLYQGNYNGHLLLDAQATPPHVYLDDTLNQVQIGLLLTDLTRKNLVSGIMDAVIKMNSEVTTVENLQKALAGTVSLQLTNGALQGINIAHALRKVKALLKKQPLPANESLKTDFSSLKATLVAKEGILYNDDLDVKSPLLRVKGQGRFTLATQQFDFLLKTAVVETAKGQEGKELEELKGITIPLKVSGMLPQPEVKPDLQVIQDTLAEKAKVEALKKLEEEKRKLLEKGKDKVPEEVRRLLDGFNLKDLAK